ncbi:MAG TPA: right-handed parallel beta-helix repeat-containing protein [Thermotogota bacterium]|nr:right-handed parallel beta-helix repeat-containing protein [Thermotogota bacterium]HRW35971.1 right-handed parallel beta-helix repeat-containing protein [Thermotogota bacterium]
MKKIFIFLFMMILFNVMFFSKVLEVGSPQSKYTTINSAILASADGDVIRIYAGNYTENLRFSKSISLEGINTHNVILKPLNSKLPTIMVENCKQLTVSGMTIYGETISISLAMTNAIIKDNKINSNRDGIRAGTLNHEIKISNNQISGNFDRVKNINTNGIILIGIGKTTIENNQINAFGSGIYLGGKKPVKISENQIHANYFGVYASGNTEAMIIGNRFYDNNRSAILLVSKPIVSISSNAFTNNPMYDIMLSSTTCSQDFLIEFTGKITGNANIAENMLKICPTDYQLPENFIKDRE